MINRLNSDNNPTGWDKTAGELERSSFDIKRAAGRPRDTGHLQTGNSHLYPLFNIICLNSTEYIQE